MAKTKSVSSRPERRLSASVLFTPISDKQRRELRRLAAKPDSQIDLSAAPEAIPPAGEIQIGRFYRPIKQLVPSCRCRRARLVSRTWEDVPDIHE
jgi:hypothetical protein